MISLSSVLALAVLGTPVLLLFMLLPTFVELRKPRDAGPRLIMPELARSVVAPVLGVRLLPDIEVGCELDFLLVPFVSDVLGVLPSLDA